jgi:hypothetical protein
MAIDSVNEEFRRPPACAVDAEKLAVLQGIMIDAPAIG